MDNTRILNKYFNVVINHSLLSRARSIIDVIHKELSVVVHHQLTLMFFILLSGGISMCNDGVSLAGVRVLTLFRIVCKYMYLFSLSCAEWHHSYLTFEGFMVS